LAFGILINKDMVRRILAHHYQPSPSGTGPSWLTFLGHFKDSLWSIDLFRSNLRRCTPLQKPRRISLQGGEQ
jgi:hypothetical protein